MIALLVNYGVMRWVLASKWEHITGETEDRNGQWTGQDFKSYNTDGIQYTLLGPTRIFASSFFKPVYMVWSLAE